MKSVLAISFVLLPFAWSCSMPVGWKAPTLVEEIQKGERILYGRVRNKYPDPTSPSYNTVFMAEFEVFCVLKGVNTQPIVNITGAGYIPGLCTSTEFADKTDYVAIVDFQLKAERDINATEENLAKIRKACGLNPVTRPERSTSTVACPVSTPNCANKDQEGDPTMSRATFNVGLPAVILTTVASVVAMVAS